MGIIKWVLSIKDNELTILALTANQEMAKEFEPVIVSPNKVRPGG